jgi:hypothetical protein
VNNSLYAHGLASEPKSATLRLRPLDLLMPPLLQKQTAAVSVSVLEAVPHNQYVLTVQ